MKGSVTPVSGMTRGDPADDDEDLQGEDRGQAGGQQLGERVARQRGDLEAALDRQQVGAQHRARTDQAQLVDDHRVDEVGLRGGQQRRIADLQDGLPEAAAEEPAVGLREDRLRDLVAAARRVVEAGRRDAATRRRGG